MKYEKNYQIKLIESLKGKFNDYALNVEIPPPVFEMMKGKIIEFDAQKMNMIIMFPIQKKYKNPFGNMQGGMIAAAIDNTFGPLSMLVAPPNYTRKMELKYIKPVSENIKYIVVEAKVQEIKGSKIIMEGKVLDDDDKLLVTAMAIHWILK